MAPANFVTQTGALGTSDITQPMLLSDLVTQYGALGAAALIGITTDSGPQRCPRATAVASLCMRDFFMLYEPEASAAEVINEE